MFVFFHSSCRAALLVACSALQTLADVSVPLDVVNRTPFRRTGEMVVSGIPLPLGAGITAAANLAIRDAAGRRVPSQFEVTARWGGPVHDGSRPIKWVLATFPATLEANASARYVLEQGEPDPTPGQLQLEDSASRLTIDTGAARFVLNKQRFSLLETVSIGGVAITRAEGSGLSLLDAQGVRYLSTVAPPRTFALETLGPLRAVVKVSGTLTSADGRPGLDYTLWLTFYGGRTEVRGALTLGNHREALLNEAFNCCKPDVFNFFGSNSFSFKELSASLQLAEDRGGFGYRLPGPDGVLRGPVVESVKAYQDSAGTDYWNRYDAGDQPRPNSYNRFRGYRISDGGRNLGEGDQHPGWCLLETAGTAISGGILEFWQNYPKALAGSASGALELQFFPKDHAGTFNFRVGEEKTHEFFFNFHSGSGGDPEGLAAALCSPLFAAAPGSWYVGSRALEDTATSPHGSVESRMEQAPAARPGSGLVPTAKYDYFNDRTLLLDPNYSQGYYYTFRSFWQSTSAPSALDYFDFYGWYWWGDTMLDFEMAGDGKAGSHTGKYDFDHGAWLQYFRTGDARWREIALALSRHRERQMLHDVGFVHHDADGWSVWQDAMWGHSQHDVSGNADGNRNPISGSPEVAFGARGSWLNYHLTGYPPSRRFAEKAARYHHKYWSLDNRYQASSELGLDVRALANSVNALTAAYRVTAEPRYADLVLAIMTARAPEKQSFIQGPRPGAGGSIGVFMLTQYICALARFSDAAEEMGASAAAQLARGQVVRFTDWMIAHGSNTSQPIATSLNPQGWFGIYGTFRNDGSNTRSDVLVNNWQLTAADCAAFAYAYTGNRQYMAAADRYFENAASNPFYEDSVLIYSDTKEAVNHATFGHAYLYWKDKLGRAGADLAAPVLEWIQPLDDADISGTVTLKVRATDDLAVQRVEYSLDGIALGSSTRAPFDFAFASRTVTNGRHALAAVAFDFAGNASPVRVLGILVQNQVDTQAPRVTLLDPAEPSVWAGTVTLRADAVDDTSVAGLQFLLDGQPLGPFLAAAPYAFDLDTRSLADGSHLVSARATDPSGNAGTSAGVAVSIGNHNRPPTAVLDLETEGFLQAGARVGFSAARSSDPEGGVLSCSWDFGDGGAAAGPVTAHAYAEAGTYRVSVAVSDGSSTSVASRSITVYPAGAVQVITLRPASDTLVRSSHPGNYGRGHELVVYNGDGPDYRSLLRFDLGPVTLPAGATLVSARLDLAALSTQGAPIEAYGVTRPWAEGTGSYGNTLDGATWAQAEPGTAWTSAGGDIDACSDHGLGANGVVASVLPRTGINSLELRPLVARWLEGSAPNHGVLLALSAGSSYTGTTFGSRESGQPPTLVISYLSAAVPDTTAPSVRLVAPGEGAAWAGTVTLSAEASDDRAVAEVGFQVDGKEAGRATAAAGSTYTCTLDTQAFGNGRHTVHAVAVDASGNTGESAVVTVSIDNPDGSPEIREVVVEAAADALFRASYEGNYGAHDRLWAYNGLGPDYRSVLRFDLAPLQLPAGAALVSAQLRLRTLSSQGAPVLAYRVTRPWTEGTGTYGNTRDGVTWEQADAGCAWSVPGGDFDAQSDYGEGANGVVARVVPQEGTTALELRALVAEWLAGTAPNHGVLLAHPSSTSYTGTAFGSRESGAPPSLTITYSVPR